MSGKAVLVDTSVWIQCLSKADPGLMRQVGELQRERTARLARPILAELLQGARSEAEEAVIGEIETQVISLPELGATWHDAGRLSKRLRAHGQTVPLPDCYLASLALGHAASVLTLDRHFETLHRHCGVALLMPARRS